MVVLDSGKAIRNVCWSGGRGVICNVLGLGQTRAGDIIVGDMAILHMRKRILDMCKTR